MIAEVQRLELSADVQRALDPHRRFVFALVGHIFNELTLLQKWIHVSRLPPGNRGPQEDAAAGVTMFLLRLLSSKVYEALHGNALRKESIAAVLRTDYFGNVEGLNEKWQGVIAHYEQLEWLGWIRKKGGFHYMNENQWGPSLVDSMFEGAYIYTGKRFRDTYFHWSEMTAALPAMLHVNANDPFEGLEQMLHELGELLGDLTECLARGLQSFMSTSGVGKALGEPVRFDAPKFEAPALYYFFADDRLK